MPVVAVVNRKGGSGKSTLATHLAAWCATTGRAAMLGDVDFQGSAQAWLKRRGGHAGVRGRAIVGWSADPRNVLRPPAGVTHVVLDTPGGLRGLDLAKVVMTADALLLPVCNSVFDRESAADCYAELKQLPRVASGRCKVAAVGMRIDARTRGEQALRGWADALGLPFIGMLRETQTYVRCAEQGLTVFDLPAARVQADLEQWQPILDWLLPVFQPPRMAQPERAEPPPRAAALGPDAAAARGGPRPSFSPATAQVPLDVLEGPRRSPGLLGRIVDWLGHRPTRRSLQRDF
ncbi:ParA family protein [uncultured Piscinibacter sp.]|uniref:ParA family protein n=1 Tax=uncultured Piscinibacter sp. TaxID=1131835 RepID=UPI00260D88EE|nr:ParA family protein [uncultured Piscinibacter sp.]